MNLQQKKFIREKLIPFVLREQGRGFAMSEWTEYLDEGGKIKLDGVFRTVPKCNTVACIGGSAQILFSSGKNFYASMSDEDIADRLGLTLSQAQGLFYQWEGKSKMCDGHGWPLKFASRYKKAKTTLGKAKVAVALLEEVVKTNGKILDPK